ncbi:hypothetical protein [Enterococcus gilvus]|uniref:hypothetical protein n=1 Tax=Enterococcus gilvus TaxID=160453 RepID=UPI00345EBEC1
MKRNQHYIMKKNTKLKWMILFLLAIIILLLASIFLNIYAQSDSDSRENTLVTTSNISEQTTPSEEQSVEENYPYSVSFDTDHMYKGEFSNEWEYSLSTQSHTGEILVRARPKDYPDPKAHMEEKAVFVPQTIDTKKIQISENGLQKEVKVNTELKLSPSRNAVSLDFFTPFNGNDTKVFAYYMKNGHLALAFTPANPEGYQVIVYKIIEFVRI